MNPDLGSTEDFFSNVATCEKTWSRSDAILRSKLEWEPAVKFLLGKGKQFKIERAIGHSAIYLMERVLVEYATNNLLRAENTLEIQLRIIACLVVASKYEGGEVPDIPKFIQACARPDVTSPMFFVAEFEVLRIAGTLRRFPPMVIADALLDIHLCRIGANVRAMSLFLSEIVLSSFELHTKYAPSLLAGAIVMTIDFIRDDTTERRPSKTGVVPDLAHDLTQVLGHPKDAIDVVVGEIFERVLREHQTHPCGKLICNSIGSPSRSQKDIQRAILRAIPTVSPTSVTTAFVTTAFDFDQGTDGRKLNVLAAAAAASGGYDIDSEVSSISKRKDCPF